MRKFKIDDEVFVSNKKNPRYLKFGNIKYSYSYISLIRWSNENKWSYENGFDSWINTEDLLPIYFPFT
jgi:hypothetical protein